MNLTVEFKQAEIKSTFDWQIVQEVNVKNDDDQVIAKAELEIITLNKHRGAEQSCELLQQQGVTDWEVPLSLFFKKQNISADLVDVLQAKVDTKAKDHILIEAISVLPSYRKQGVAKYLLTAIAQHFPKVQSITVLSMPMQMFVDAQDCDTEANKAYYQALNLGQDDLSPEQLTAFFQQSGFSHLAIDDSALEAPLPFKVFIASPTTLLAS
ncbi:Acetyltransferase (GNAT) family protein [Colwellia chukchiensis]|uniref:Acetyltransferase (GNAT) family protein n=1 Tax=Colwellia chukchiensis TaxID=641665 RepID=A0A1H7TP42_9GAMM|nr:GNAT family N-acetyltransferase [Colwellia chukchiensis]SEL86315.1 Acetyltransferase (GNAT) family protein [Colwellia chukchiensis]